MVSEYFIYVFDFLWREIPWEAISGLKKSSECLDFGDTNQGKGIKGSWLCARRWKGGGFALGKGRKGIPNKGKWSGESDQWKRLRKRGPCYQGDELRLRQKMGWTSHWLKVTVLALTPLFLWVVLSELLPFWKKALRQKSGRQSRDLKSDTGSDHSAQLKSEMGWGWATWGSSSICCVVVGV